MDYKKIGKYIRKKREERGYTQYKLADLLFISREAVSKWERGVSIPDVSILVPLSEILGVTPTDILLGKDIEEKDVEVDQEVITMFNRL